LDVLKLVVDDVAGALGFRVVLRDNGGRHRAGVDQGRYVGGGSTVGNGVGTGQESGGQLKFGVLGGVCGLGEDCGRKVGVDGGEARVWEAAGVKYGRGGVRSRDTGKKNEELHGCSG